MRESFKQMPGAKLGANEVNIISVNRLLMKKNKWPYRRRIEKAEAKERRKRRKRETGGQGITTRASRCAIGVRSAGGLCALLAGGVSTALEKRGANSTVSRQRVSCIDSGGMLGVSELWQEMWQGRWQSSGTAGSWQAAVGSRDRGGGWNRGIGE